MFRRAEASVVAEVKTQVWEEFGETMEIGLKEVLANHATTQEKHGFAQPKKGAH